MKTMIGKQFELLNINNSVMISFKINYAKEEVRQSYTDEDGNTIPQHITILVSENNTSWFIVHGGNSDRIVDINES